MKNQITFALCLSLIAPPGYAETTRATLLNIVEPMGISTASKRALQPALEQASLAQIDSYTRGLFYDEIGADEMARPHFEHAAAALDAETPGKDAWCIAYKLLRITDDKVDQRQPAVQEMRNLRQALKIPLSLGDLEKTATTAHIRDLWNALPEAAQTESGPLPKTLTLLERAVALAVRGFNQDESVSQLSHASARCFLKGPNLKPLYLEGARLDLADVQFALANDLAETTAFPGFWHEAVKMYRHVAATATPPLSVIAATSAARVSERLLTADTTHPSPMDWPEILATYRAGMAAGHEAALALYADALQQGLGGLSPDTAEAVRLYKALLDKNDGLFGGLMAIAFMVHAQEQITILWRAGKLELNEAEQRRYLLSSARP